MNKSNTVSTDPIADMLTRVRNANMVNKPTISVPHSKAKEAVAKILVEEGFLSGIKTVKEGDFKVLEVAITGDVNPSKITEITRLSKPGRRHYVKYAEIPTIKQGRGVVIISTSQGVMTGASAKTKKLGGELICKVY